jgi:hypothetical protein
VRLKRVGEKTVTQSSSLAMTMRYWALSTSGRFVVMRSTAPSFS